MVVIGFLYQIYSCGTLKLRPKQRGHERLKLDNGKENVQMNVTGRVSLTRGHFDTCLKITTAL